MECKLKIGIVVPTYNSAKTLEWSLLSLKNQEGCSVRIIVVDSGSTDGTLEICSRLAVETLYEPPGNMYRAINAGMKLMDTEWVSYLNSDDIVYRDSYQRLIALGNKVGADVVYGHSDYIDWAGRFIFLLKAVSPVLLRWSIHTGIVQFCQPAAIFRRATYESLGGFDEKFRSIADFDFFARAILSRKKFVRLSFPPVAAFRLHPNQFSHKENTLAQEEIATFFHEQKLHKGFVSLASFGVWRVINAKNYLIRLLRNGRLKSRD